MSQTQDNDMQPTKENPFAVFLEQQNVMVLDGGLATTLEALGYDLNDESVVGEDTP